MFEHLSPDIIDLLNFIGSVGSGLASVYVAQQIAHEEHMPRILRRAHRLTLAAVAVLFVNHAFGSHDLAGAMLACACFALLVLRAITHDLIVRRPGPPPNCPLV